MTKIKARITLEKYVSSTEIEAGFAYKEFFHLLMKMMLPSSK